MEVFIMQFTLKQVSSLEKIRNVNDLTCKEIFQKTALAGERVSYQICLNGAPTLRNISVSLESELAEYITLYNVKPVAMDRPTTYPDLNPEEFITMEPGLMPDLLVPLSMQNNLTQVSPYTTTLWVRVDLPKDIKPGTYLIKVSYHLFLQDQMTCDLSSTMKLEVIPAVIPDQKLIYTRWFYADCIADYHQVEVYSENHWDLISKYIAAAADAGVNMILVPVHTPPLDTGIGTTRTCVQLVDIEKKGDIYEFNFDKFHRFVEIAKCNGIKYFEIAHMFSQWGAKCAPNIMVTENGVKDYMFGWHVAANSPEYIDFLKQYIAAISAELVKADISENTYFHISDEPGLHTIDTYKIASDIMRPLIGKSKTFDALSKYEFYENGLVECPVTSVAHVHDFLEHDIPNQWTYYCCGPQKTFTNSIMAMPSFRNRIIGFQMYRYDIKGFLHWGLNFYNSAHSRYQINPYVTTSSDGAFPSGDPFILYPGQNTVFGCIRGQVFYEALQDMRICLALEALIGRDAVVQMIDNAAGYTLRFDTYPQNAQFIEDLRAAMVEKIKNLQA